MTSYQYERPPELMSQRKVIYANQGLSKGLDPLLRSGPSSGLGWAGLGGSKETRHSLGASEMTALRMGGSGLSHRPLAQPRPLLSTGASPPEPTPSRPRAPARCGPGEKLPSLGREGVPALNCMELFIRGWGTFPPPRATGNLYHHSRAIQNYL